MNFVSFEFAFFLTLVFGVYWLVLGKSIKLQNLFLLVVSYIFYGWWDWRFLSLIVFSSIVDFICGILLERFESKFARRCTLAVSLASNLGLLLFFKYFGFFVESTAEALEFFGFAANLPTLKILLPVGISFYTFQTLSYSIDVYRGKLRAETNWIAFFAYVAFFPQLVAGPIERATNFLPQFLVPRTFNYDSAFEGIKQMAWGFFKKVAIADNCAVMVDEIFKNYEQLSSTMLLLGVIYFAVQIYCDFSGYSDIAIGCAALLGFKLCANFRYPYFSRDVAEFWRRWHISLSTWFRDYLYIPLGGSRAGKWTSIRNVFIVFLVSGLWHGANWTFVIWGLIHALMFLPLLLMSSNRSNLDDVAYGKLVPSLSEMARVLSTFFIVCLAWVFFRSPTLADATAYLIRLFGSGDFGISVDYLWIVPLILFLFIFEWLCRSKPFPTFSFNSPGLNLMGYFLLVYTTSVFCRQTATFIYFQF